MPIVHVDMLAGRDEASLRKIAEGITRVLVDAAGVRPEAVRILINEVPATRWFVAGVPKAPPEAKPPT